MNTNTRHADAESRPRARASAFTVIEVLVAVGVIGVLIAIMLPSISLVQDSARKVVCASNTRQIGLGLNMFSQENSDYMPPSVFLPRTVFPQRAADQRPELMDIVRTSSEDFAPRDWGQWDGIGLLYSMEYLNSSDIYYCPSHQGNHPADRYEGQWDKQGTSEIVSNYQFRGLGPNGEQRLYEIPARAAIVTDTLRSYDNLNHDKGFNILHAGLSVSWSDDAGSREIIEMLLRGSGDDGNDGQFVQQAWSALDGGASPTLND